MFCGYDFHYSFVFPGQNKDFTILSRYDIASAHPVQITNFARLTSVATKSADGIDFVF